MKANEKYWVGGRAGAGKSTLCNELVLRGLYAVDSDNIPGLASWVDINNGKSVEVDPGNYIDDTKVDWLWNEGRLKEVVAEPKELFLCGSAGNDIEFFDLFSKVFVLDIDPETQLYRLQTRESKFGKDPAMQQEILAWQKDFVEKMLGLGAIALDASQPVEKVANELLAHLQ